MKLSKFFEFYAKLGSYFVNFYSLCAYFRKNNTRFVISIKNSTDRHIISTFSRKKNFQENSCGVPQAKRFKIFFPFKVFDLYASRRSLRRRLRIRCYFYENMHTKNKNRKIRPQERPVEKSYICIRHSSLNNSSSIGKLLLYNRGIEYNTMHY